MRQNGQREQIPKRGREGAISFAFRGTVTRVTPWVVMALLLTAGATGCADSGAANDAAGTKVTSGAQATWGSHAASGEHTSTQEKRSATAQAEHNQVSSGATSEIQTVVKGHWAQVTRVVDGDTLEIDGKTKVRLIGVNTPETVKPGTPVQPYGEQAKAYTTQQVSGKRVFIETDVQTTDRYGRLLAYVYLRAPKTTSEIAEDMLNARLLRNGYAQLMTIPPNVKYADLFLRLERQARSENKGLWALGIYKPEVSSTNDVFLPGKAAKAGTTARAPEPASGEGGKRSSVSGSCSDPKIKGNINSKGEKIYHVPGDPWYDKTVPEQWFCTEADAEAAGYRAPR
jgi:micrococcal nuclease